MTTDEQYVPDEGQVRAWCREGTGDYPDVMDEWLDRFLARVKRDAAREALAAAEHRIARLEAQTSIRGRAVVMYRERAREAEAERNEWKALALQERGAALDALEQIKVRDARIKAVQDVLDQKDTDLDAMSNPPREHRGVLMADIRRALDGDA